MDIENVSENKEEEVDNQDDDDKPLVSKENAL